LKFSGRCGVGYSLHEWIARTTRVFACEGIWAIFGVRDRL